MTTNAKQHLCIMRCLQLARAAIPADAAGFGKNVAPLFGYGTRGGRFQIRPQLAKYFGGNGDLRSIRELGEPDFTFHGPEYCVMSWRMPWGVTLPEMSCRQPWPAGGRQLPRTAAGK